MAAGEQDKRRYFPHLPTEAEVNAERFPNPELVRRKWEVICARVAYTARVEVVKKGTVKEIIAQNPTLDPKEVKTELVFDLDTLAANIIEVAISDGAEEEDDWETDVVSCEGHKEGVAKKLGKIPKILKGLYGRVKGKGRIAVDLDPIEGTDATANNEPGGMSFAAISTWEGIIKTPKDVDGEDIDYMNKLAASPRMKGKVSLEKTPQENIKAIADEYGIASSFITVVVLDRPRNHDLIASLEEAGATVKRIKAMDLEPALRALQEPENPQENGVQILYGSGGWQEGVGTAVAAKAWGAVFEAQIVRLRKDEQGKELFLTDSEVIKLDELVPGEKAHSMIVFGAITPIKEFDMPAVDLENGRVTTFAIDPSEPKGYRIKNHNIHDLKI